MGYKKKLHHEHFTLLNTNDEIVAPLWISFRDDPEQSIYPEHGHAWGEFIFTFKGVMQVKINQINYITPSPHGLWLPPHLQHSGLNRTSVSHGTFYIHESLCQQLPTRPGIMLSSPLVSALFQHLRENRLADTHPEHIRLLHVLHDQIQHAELITNYLPHTEHTGLRQILDYLHQNPADQSHLSDLAQKINMTERTLSRYSQKELGMSLHEWRQRLKVIKAMSMLNEDKSIEHIAYDLGYANASAFINMFKRWMKLTPDQFRKHRQND